VRERFAGDRRRGYVWVGALVLALAFLSIAAATAFGRHERNRATLDKALSNEAQKQSEALEHYFARARSLTQVTAANPAFHEFYEEPGDRQQKVLAQDRTIKEANSALAYLEKLFPGAIGEACFIDHSGPENARAVSGKIAPITDLSPDETGAPFFKPTFSLRPGQVYQAEPYLSPDTHSWVVSNSTPLPTSSGRSPAIVHFEISVESFRREAADSGSRFDTAIVEANSGRVIVDTRYPQAKGDQAKLGRPFDKRFQRVASLAGRAFGEGTMDFAGKPGAFREIARTPHNANDWIVVAMAKTPATSWVSELGVAEIVMAALGLLLLAFAIYSLRTSHARLQTQATTDSLTGLGNRRQLVGDLEDALASRRAFVVAIFDLDGFKGYNDTFGHPAGDELLKRLAANLGVQLAGIGTSYRLGGDEFCALAPLTEGRDREQILALAERGLTEHGEGFTITCSHGSVTVPTETNQIDEVLRIADQRMYAHKNSARASAGRQSTDIAVSVLAERYPDIGEHLYSVSELAGEIGRRIGLPQDELTALVHAASLHDVGKIAVPDAILTKPGPLDEDEWQFIRQHTIIGERILGSAPALADAARLVRASHERIDGTGYPDGLADDEIPLGARIISVCDAFDAMTSPRPYRTEPMSVDEALAELRENTGTQFDPEVVAVFCYEIRTLRPAPAGSAPSAV
jgi:diguanylate cyclase (GGDEF)-like protein